MLLWLKMTGEGEVGLRAVLSPCINHIMLYCLVLCVVVSFQFRMVGLAMVLPPDVTTQCSGGTGYWWRHGRGPHFVGALAALKYFMVLCIVVGVIVI